jgi:hypothetical protein
MANRPYHRVQVFSPAGVFQFKWGDYGTKHGQFRFGYRDQIDEGASGFLYVLDTGNSRVQAFSPSGNYAGSFPTPVAGAYCHGLSVSPLDGNIWIAGRAGTNSFIVRNAPVPPPFTPPDPPPPSLGTQLSSYNYPSVYDFTQIKHDINGNLYAGLNNSQYDYTQLVKIDPEGNILWGGTYSGVASMTTGIAVPDGGSYVYIWDRLGVIARYSAGGGYWGNSYAQLPNWGGTPLFSTLATNGDLLFVARPSRSEMWNATGGYGVTEYSLNGGGYLPSPPNIVTQIGPLEFAKDGFIAPFRMPSADNPLVGGISGSVVASNGLLYVLERNMLPASTPPEPPPPVISEQYQPRAMLWQHPR